MVAPSVDDGRKELDASGPCEVGRDPQEAVAHHRAGLVGDDRGRKALHTGDSGLIGCFDSCHTWPPLVRVIVTAFQVLFLIECLHQSGKAVPCRSVAFAVSDPKDAVPDAHEPAPGSSPTLSPLASLKPQGARKDAILNAIGPQVDCLHEFHATPFGVRER